MLDEASARAMIDMHENQLQTVMLLHKLHRSILFGYTLMAVANLSVGFAIGVFVASVKL